MKLLFDNNISIKLVNKLDDIFPGSSHVMSEYLDEADDQEVWRFAKERGFAIVTKDSDFNEILVLKGLPPKVVWIRMGNCRVSHMEKLIRSKFIVLREFFHNRGSGLMEVK